MHDIWNPWHGCRKISEGCQNCYMYFLDGTRDKDGSVISRCKTGFDYPLRKDRSRNFKIKPGENIRVCMTSDFFLEEADAWRQDAWDMMRFRSDVVFTLLTKRAHRIRDCLPPDWDDGYPNVRLGVTTENQARADERVPLLLNTPARHKYVCCAPLLGPIDLAPYLASGEIEQVLAGGENYDGCRPCDYAWPYSLYEQCRDADVEFCFYETGTNFVKDGARYWCPKRRTQSEWAYYSGLYFKPTKKPGYELTYPGTDIEINTNEMYVPHFNKTTCPTCGNRYICNGCSECGKCR